MMTDPAASRPGTHLDPDRMADLLEGLLDAAAADAARAHLASCPVCSADFALISGEVDLGMALPPVPIPQDVVTRIEAALYREPPLGTGAAADDQSASAAPGATAATAAARPRRRRFRITLGALAGATLVVAGGFGVVTALNSGSSVSKSGDASSAAGVRGPAVQSGENGDHAGAAPSPLSPQLGSGPNSNSALNALTIQEQAKDLLGRHANTPAAGSATEAGPCRPVGMDSGTKALAGEQTRYEDKSAWLLIYAEPGSTTLADVYVVDAASCTSDNPGQVLFQFVIPRS